MGFGKDIAALGILGIVLNIIGWGLFLAFLWAVWNWIVVPTLPYIASLF
jgi:hypothetical protein